MAYRIGSFNMCKLSFQDEDTGTKTYLSSELLGGDVFERAEKAARAKKMSKLMAHCAKDIVLLEKICSN